MEQGSLFDKPKAPAVPPGSVPAHFIDPALIAHSQANMIILYYVDPRTPGSWCKLRVVQSIAKRRYEQLKFTGQIKQILVEECRPMAEGVYREPTIPYTQRERRYLTQRGV